MGNVEEKISFPVVETFVSINGEGRKSGELALFIRFRGCNLGCSYCDTSWANKPDVSCKELSLEELCSIAESSGVKNVTLTGGEPLLQKNINSLTERLTALEFNIEIETNGSIALAPFVRDSGRMSFTMDYKLPGSGMEEYMCLDNFEILQREDTVKFVCSSVADLERAEEITGRYSLTERCGVYLSPVFGKIAPHQIVDFMKERCMNGVRLQLQLHKFIWDPEKRGV